MEKDNITQVLNLLIGELRAPVTCQSVEEELARHPKYATLLAFSDLLNNWRIPNMAYKLTYEELLAAEVPVPFVAYLNNAKFALITHITNNQVIISNDTWNRHKLGIDEFKALYGGSILVAEKDETSGEIDYPLKQRREKLNNIRTPLVVWGALIVLFAFVLLNPSYTLDFNWQVALLTLFKTTGVAASILLLIQSIDANNPLIQKLCGGDNNKDCNAILSSKAAKITDELSWSEVGFFYFGGTLLTVLLNPDNNGTLQIIALINIISLPYTFYSIYYQWRIAGRWCVLCCTVQAILWFEFFALLPYLQNGIQLPGLQQWGNLFIGMAIPILSWIFIKPYLQLSKQIQPLKQQLRKFKYNTELFNKLLNEEEKYTLPAEEDSLVIGNREAKHVITMVSNPKCQPCSKAHKELDEWMASRDDIKLQVVFPASNNETDVRTKVALHIMALQASQDSVSLKHAVNDWYEHEQNDYDAWVKAYPVEKKIPYDQALEAQYEWCLRSEIKSTPTIFINGRKLPGIYQISDIKYFI
ncbi:vitamin K epoxide reductase family protein [Mucilaginibacter sp.]|uniref:vitamin K epoxide reductase family protein n=1 Tax=Mucilaginibacter sp. TaxID=1882438 RepID=UPI00260F9C44|nr:vitamin K epoxide reductase family protein [Mucilaginibacter sp.]MDB5029327.1 hypothetical protein [Mucilaginibacter sp.]